MCVLSAQLRLQELKLHLNVEQALHNALSRVHLQNGDPSVHQQVQQCEATMTHLNCKIGETQVRNLLQDL